jgi:hypothetical protein
MKIYEGNDGIKQMIYDERKAFVDQMWERYRQTTDKNGNAGDYRILAEKVIRAEKTKRGTHLLVSKR